MKRFPCQTLEPIHCTVCGRPIKDSDQQALYKLLMPEGLTQTELAAIVAEDDTDAARPNSRGARCT
jgi:hypothetical protein